METTSGLKIDISGQGKPTKLFVDNLNIKSGKSPLNFVSPKGHLTTRGKTAQTGRNQDGLPQINFQRSPSNRVRDTLVSQGVKTRYGNLLKEKTNTIDLINQEFMKNKNYADIRVNKLGQKQIPDQYSKTLKTNGAEDVESIPSDIDNDQWAEINKYDYELFREQQRKQKEEFLQKRQMVKNTLDLQIREQ